MTTGMETAELVSQSPATTPPIASGSEPRMVIGVEERAEQQDQHHQHQHQAGRHGGGKAREDLAHDLGVAGLLDARAGRHVFHRGQLPDGVRGLR